MACDTYKGQDFTLAGQINASGTYAAVPGTPDAQLLKFSQVSLNRNPTRQVDPTIDGNVLDPKQDEVDEMPEGSLTAIADLNDASFWLTLLMGTPVTTGAGPTYTHTYTLTKDCKPDALLELYALRSGQSVPMIRRYLGAMLKDFSWDLMAEDQNFVFNMLMAREVRPFPTTAFDTTLTTYPKNRMLAAKGSVYDVNGASTLGYISGCTMQVALNPQPRKLADAQPGIGLVQPGVIAISGTMQVLLTDSGISQYGALQTSKPVTITSAGKTSGSLTWSFPSVEFSEPANEISDKNGILRTYNWRAHSNPGDAAVTAVLVNAVPTP